MKKAKYRFLPIIRFLMLPLSQKMSVMEIYTDEYFMSQALIEAQKAFDKGEVPVGAVITYKNAILARAHNLTERLVDVTAHAEMQAITAAANAMGGKYLNDCTLYVTIEPCVMCGAALGWAHIGRIVYGAKDEKRGYSLFSPSVLHPKTEVVSGVKAAECADMMIRFFKSKR